AVEAQHGLLEVAADRAADAAAVEKDDLVVDRLDQEMIQADLTELVDHDCRVGEIRLTQEAAEEGCLAGAEEAGQQIDDNRGTPDVVHRRAAFASAPAMTSGSRGSQL